MKNVYYPKSERERERERNKRERETMIEDRTFLRTVPLEFISKRERKGRMERERDKDRMDSDNKRNPLSFVSLSLS